ncbi:MAG: beta-ketoacyl-[acyl-carrier-protein] synthase family protein [Fuerstiella sp.]
MLQRRVVVTGASVVTSLGCCVSDVWNRVCGGSSGVLPLDDAAARDTGLAVAGRISEFDATALMPVNLRQLRRMDQFARFSLVAAHQACCDSEIDLQKLNPARCGAVIGSGFGGLATIENQHRRLSEQGPERVSAFFIPSLMINAASGQLAVHWGLQGPCLGVAGGGVSGTQAIGQAFRLIQSGVADVMLCGGAETPLSRIGRSGFEAGGPPLSGDGISSTVARPFDKDRDGCIPGEGAGVLVLEELDSARRRGATVLAELVGYGRSFADPADSKQVSASTGNGMLQAMQAALADAQKSVDQVDYLHAHAGGQVTADRAEASAIRRVFARSDRQPAVSSTKGQLGHLFGAAGAVEAVLCVQALTTNLVPPTGNLKVPEENSRLDHVIGSARQLPVRCVMSNSFCLTGHSASLVFARPG